VQQLLLLCLMPRLRLLLRLLLLLRLRLRLRLLLLLLLYLYLLHHPASQPAHLLALGGNTKMVVRDPIVQLSAHAVRFFAVVVTQVSLLLDRRMIRVRVNGAMASASRPSTRGGSLPKRLVFHHPFTTTGRRKAQISRRRHAITLARPHPNQSFRPSLPSSRASRPRDPRLSSSRPSSRPPEPSVLLTEPAVLLTEPPVLLTEPSVLLSSRTSVLPSSRPSLPAS
jgi:hypothetical protein